MSEVLGNLHSLEKQFTHQRESYEKKIAKLKDDHQKALEESNQENRHLNIELENKKIIVKQVQDDSKKIVKDQETKAEKVRDSFFCISLRNKEI